MSSAMLAGLLYKNFPDSNLLIDATDAKSLRALVDASDNCGDDLFRWIVLSAYAATDGEETDTRKFEKLLERGIGDVRAIIRALPDASGFYR